MVYIVFPSPISSAKIPLIPVSYRLIIQFKPSSQKSSSLHSLVSTEGCMFNLVNSVPFSSSELASYQSSILLLFYFLLETFLPPLIWTFCPFPFKKSSAIFCFCCALWVFIFYYRMNLVYYSIFSRRSSSLSFLEFVSVFLPNPVFLPHFIIFKELLAID